MTKFTFVTALLFTAMNAHAATTADVAAHLLPGGDPATYAGTTQAGESCSASMKVLGDALVADVDDASVRSEAEDSVFITGHGPERFVQIRGERSTSIRVLMRGGEVKSIAVSKPGVLYGSNVSVCENLVRLRGDAHSDPVSQLINSMNRDHRAIR